MLQRGERARFADDPTVPAETRRQLLDSLGEMACVPVLEAILRTSIDRLVADTCKDLITAETQKLFDNAMTRLGTIYTVHSDEGAWSSLANTSFEGIEDAVKATAFFAIPLTDEGLDADYPQQRRLVVTRISALGISREMAESMVEEAEDASSRYAHPEPDMSETPLWA